MLPESLQGYAKAAYPALLTLIGVIGQVIATGEFDRAEFATVVTGLLAAGVSFLVPNTAEVHVHEGDPPDDESTTTLGTNVADHYKDAA